jgi:predicted DNA-binding transcriptional regulator YafY
MQLLTRAARLVQSRSREGSRVAGTQGRDQREPMERLVRIAAALRVAGEEGVTGERLADVAGFRGEARADQVSRELRHLNRQGWQIDNIAPEGDPARYRMRSVDNRLRVKLTPGQQRELQRAVLLADRDDLVRRLGLPESRRPLDVEAELPVGGHDATLAAVLTGVRLGCLLRYRYLGSDRVVHPQSVTTQNGKWYLRGREDGSDVVKAFVVGRMSNVQADEPGSATREPVDRHAGLNPMTWELDPPVEVTLRTTGEYYLDVLRWLGNPVATEESDGVVVLRYDVTNRSALRTRLYELGSRVELVGPPDVRRELLDELASLGEER